MSDTSETLLEFPCQFPIKVFGRHEDEFEQLVVDIISRHVEDLTADNVRRRASGKEAYISITITITAQSKAQLDAIYQDLSNSDRVIMAL